MSGKVSELAARVDRLTVQEKLLLAVALLDEHQHGLALAVALRAIEGLQLALASRE